MAARQKHATQLQAQYPELSDINTGHAHFALRLAIREFDLLIKNGLSQEDFAATKTFLRSYTKLYAQSPAQQLGWLMDSRFYGRTDYLAELDALLEKTTLEQVNQAIRKHWQTDNMFVTIVTDDSEAKALADSLIKAGVFTTCPPCQGVGYNCPKCDGLGILPKER